MLYRERERGTEGSQTGRKRRFRGGKAEVSEEISVGGYEIEKRRRVVRKLKKGRKRVSQKKRTKMALGRAKELLTFSKEEKKGPMGKKSTED